MTEAVSGSFSTHTVSQRFAITLVAQVSKSALSFLTGLVVARGLGPVEYGNVAFLLGSFTWMRLIIDLASAQAFFTLAAERPRSRSFYAYYALWLAVAEVGVPFLLIAVLLPEHVVAVLWQSQARDHVWLAFLAATLQNYLWPQLNQLGEVVRRTYISQALTACVSLVQFTAVLVLSLLHLLTIPIFLITTSITFTAGGLLAFGFLPRPWHADAKPEGFIAIVREFVSFCRPLAVSYSLQAANGVVEVWLIQHFAGSRAQAYYALGMQISLIGLLATQALQNIFWREVAALEAAGDAERVRQTYLKAARILLVAATVPVAFLIAWTPEIVNLALGPKYHDAIPVVAIMFLYPLSQCLSTLAIVMFSIMRRTNVLAVLASINALLNMVGGYFILAPSHGAVPGIGLGALGYGAMGMATKIVALSFLHLMLLEFWINRKRGWRHDWAFRGRLFVILIGIAAISRGLGALVDIWMPQVVALILSGLVFGACVCGTFYRWPQVAGLSPEFRDGYLRHLRTLLVR